MSSEEDESNVFPPGGDENVNITPNLNAIFMNQMREQQVHPQPQQQPFYYPPYSQMIPIPENANNNNVNFYSDQDLLFSQYSLFMTPSMNLNPDPTQHQQPQLQLIPPAIQPQLQLHTQQQQQQPHPHPQPHSQQTLLPLLPTVKPKLDNQQLRRRNAKIELSPKKTIYRHKRLIENLSISSGLNTVHIKDEENDTPLLEIPSKKPPNQPKEIKDFNENEMYIRNYAISSLEQGIEIQDFLRQLKVTKTDIDQAASSSQKSKSTLKPSSEQERSKNIFAVRCLYECFESAYETICNFQSRVLLDHINSMDLSVLSSSESPTANVKKERHMSSGSISGSIGSSSGVSNLIATPRSMTYSSYMLMCDLCNVKPIGSSGLGKLIRVLFPSLTTKRLGTRGNSKYHYVGMNPKPWIKELVEIYGNGNFQLIHPPATTTTNTTASTISNSPQISENILLHEGKAKNSLIKSSHTFPEDFQLTNLNIDDPIVTTDLYQVLYTGDIIRLNDYIRRLDSEVNLSELLYKSLLYLSPLSYLLGENTIMNNLNYLSLSSHLLRAPSKDYSNIKIFLMILGRLIKLSRCSLSVSNMLLQYRIELANNLQNINFLDIVNLDIDDLMDRNLFINFFENLKNFFIEMDSVLEQPSTSTSQFVFISSIFPLENRIIMEHFVEFLIKELKKFKSKNLRFIILNFSKIITSITDETLRNNDLSMNFNNWWILNCWLNEWLNFCCELIAYQDGQ